MKRISVKEVILDLIERTDEISGQNMPQLFKWAKYCERRINSYKSYNFKAAEFTITNYQIDLPEDCLRVEKVIFGAHANDITTWFRQPYDPKVNTFFTDISTMDIVEHSWINLGIYLIDEVLWTQEQDRLIFVQNYESEIVTLWYRYIETEADGSFLVNESHNEALRLYLQIAIAEREKWRLFRSEKMLRNGVFEFINELRKKYNVAVKYAVAMDDHIDPTDKVEISDRYQVK